MKNEKDSPNLSGRLVIQDTRDKQSASMARYAGESSHDQGTHTASGDGIHLKEGEDDKVFFHFLQSTEPQNLKGQREDSKANPN